MRRDEVLAQFSTTAGDAVRIKLCGLSRPEDVAAANEASPDLVGFVVDFPRSLRNVSSAALGSLSKDVDPGIVRVGVFVNEPIETIAALYSQGAIDAVQLHGTEDEAYLKALRDASDIPLIQAFRIRSAGDVARAEDSTADLVLLDNGQGTGASFDWSLVQEVRRPFVLAGGLGPGNVASAVEAVHPWGVDMSSGIETGGRKDPAKMRAAVQAVRRGEAIPFSQNGEAEAAPPSSHTKG